MQGLKPPSTFLKTKNNWEYQKKVSQKSNLCLGKGRQKQQKGTSPSVAYYVKVKVLSKTTLLKYVIKLKIHTRKKERKEVLTRTLF